MTTRDAVRLMRCVASLERGAGDVPFELVLVLSGADDDVAEAARGLSGARVAESRWNLGFAGGCNLGRAHASGEHIVLLHDDAEAEEGWLPALVKAAERHPEAGVIGSRVVASDDGRLQLAGAAVFSDASTAPFGRGDPADSPEHLVPRPVDYCSSCSVLVRSVTWDAIGGLDELLFPGGYVDADLGMAAWAAGWTVRYEPSSLVRHRQRGSMTGGYKAFVHARNRERFRGKWAEELARREPPAADVRRAGERALARAHERAGELDARGARSGTPAKPEPVDPELGPRLAALELRLMRGYIAFADPELERVHREHANVRAALDAIRGGRWWRLRERLLPLIRLVRRR